MAPGIDSTTGGYNSSSKFIFSTRPRVRDRLQLWEKGKRADPPLTCGKNLVPLTDKKGKKLSIDFLPHGPGNRLHYWRVQFLIQTHILQVEQNRSEQQHLKAKKTKKGTRGRAFQAQKTPVLVWKWNINLKIITSHQAKKNAPSTCAMEN